VRAVGIIGYGLLLSRCNDGATKTCLLGVNASVVNAVVGIEAVVVVEVVVEVVLVVVVLVATDVVTSDVTKVTGRSLVSIIFVEAIEELKNFEVILLTAPFTLLAFLVDNIVDVATFELSGVVGLGVIGILRTSGVDFLPDPVILPVNSVLGGRDVIFSRLWFLRGFEQKN